MAGWPFASIGRVMTKHSSLDVGTTSPTGPIQRPFRPFQRSTAISTSTSSSSVAVSPDLTTAYLLRLAGKSVALVERGRCAEVDTVTRRRT